MANPFLALGAIAVGIVAATFGVLQVPGWVTSAQDASAVNDLAQIRGAQAAAVSATGSFAANLADFSSEVPGLTLTPSAGSKLDFLGATADGWCAVVRSESGGYFAATDTAVTTASQKSAYAAYQSVCRHPQLEHGFESGVNPIDKLDAGGGLWTVVNTPLARTGDSVLANVDTVRRHRLGWDSTATYGPGARISAWVYLDEGDPPLGGLMIGNTADPAGQFFTVVIDQRPELPGLQIRHRRDMPTSETPGVAATTRQIEAKQWYRIDVAVHEDTIEAQVFSEDEEMLGEASMAPTKFGVPAEFYVGFLGYMNVYYDDLIVW